METAATTKRASVVRKVGWLGVASMLALALLAPSAGLVSANGGSVDICHGTGSNSNPYVAESPSVQANGATEGQLTGGHSDHVGPVWYDGISTSWGDIIPPYVYAPNGYSFPGLNWTAEGQAIYYNGCQPVTTTTSTSASTTDTSSSTVSTSTVASSSTTAFTSTVEASSTTEATTSTSTSLSQSVEGATDAPSVTLPPTDSFGGSTGPSSDSWRILLIVGAALLASVLVLNPRKASRRS